MGLLFCLQKFSGKSQIIYILIFHYNTRYYNKCYYYCPKRISGKIQIIYIHFHIRWYCNKCDYYFVQKTLIAKVK